MLAKNKLNSIESLVFKVFKWYGYNSWRIYYNLEWER